METGSAGRTAGAGTDGTHTKVVDILAIRRRVAARPGLWTAQYDPTIRWHWIVVDDEGHELARCVNQSDAEVITETHNTWLPLCNAWYLGRRALKDRENVLNLLEKEQ